MGTTKTRRLRDACERKQAHSRKVAGKVAAQMNASAKGPPVHSYKCPLCKRWHVGRIDKHGVGHLTGGTT